MLLKELLDTIKDKTIYGRIDEAREVTPAISPDECNKDSLLFITKRVNARGIVDLPTFNERPYAIITDGILSRATDIPVIYTEGARSVLAMAYSLHYGIKQTKMQLVGVTGTNGKTTTATLIYEILDRCGIKAGLMGTGTIKCHGKNLTPSGYTMTTPDPSLLYASLKEMEQEGCEIVVMEISSHSIALSKIDGLRFTLGIFTNLSSEHMDFHNNMEDYFATKMRFFSRCDTALFNIDDYYAKRGYILHDGPKESVGIIESANIYATDIHLNGLSGSDFLYRSDGLIFKALLRLPGAHNIYNALMALGCAIKLGVKPCLAKSALASITGVCGRMEIVHIQPYVIIDYAHTPKALEILLKSIKPTLKIEQKLYLVFGCGGDRDPSKRSIMGKIAIQYADKVIITEDNNRTESFDAIAENIITDIKSSPKYIIIPDRCAAINYALTKAQDYDVVAIIGKGHERYIIDCDGMRPFDERAIIREYYGEKHED